MTDRAGWRDRRAGPLSFRLDRRRYAVPDRPARTWVLAVLSDDPADLLLDLLDEETAGELWEDAVDPDGPITVDLLAEIGRALLAAATGRPWWQATRLIGTLVDGWATFDAVAADAGLGDLLDWPIERLCHWVYWRLTRDAEEGRRAEIDAALAAPAALDGPGGMVGVPAGPSEEAAAEAWAAAGGWAAMAAEFGVADEHGIGRATTG